MLKLNCINKKVTKLKPYVHSAIMKLWQSFQWSTMYFMTFYVFVRFS